MKHLRCFLILLVFAMVGCEPPSVRVEGAKVDRSDLIGSWRHQYSVRVGGRDVVIIEALTLHDDGKYNRSREVQGRVANSSSRWQMQSRPDGISEITLFDFEHYDEGDLTGSTLLVRDQDLLIRRGLRGDHLYLESADSEIPAFFEK